MTKKGQFSSLLKPVVIMIFGILLVMVLQSLIGFQAGLEEEEAEIDFVQQPRQDFQELKNCLQVDNTGVLNASKLAEFERKYPLSEPECAEDFKYGYNVTVKEEFVESEAMKEPKVDMVFISDMSLSIAKEGEDLQQFCQVKEEIESELESMGFDVRLDVRGLNAEAYTDNVQCATKNVKSSGSFNDESWGPGTAYISENYDWREGATRFVFPMTDECPYKGGPYEGRDSDGNPKYEDCDSEDDDSIENAVEKANKNGVIVFPILGEAGEADDLKQWDQHIEYVEKIADETGGEYFRTGEVSSLKDKLVDIAASESLVLVERDTSCMLPSKPGFGKKLDLAVAVDASPGFGEEWSQVCSSIDKLEADLKLRGYKVETSVYGPGFPSSGRILDLPESIGGGEYNISEDGRNVPGCLENQGVAAESSHGEAITAWNEDLVDYSENLDDGPEAWGMVSHWVVENHPWRNTDEKYLVTVGNSDPTGGDLRLETFRAGDGTQNESDVVNELVKEANEEDVSILTFSDGNWESSSRASYGGEKNDAAELMEKAAESTAGRYTEYSTPSEIVSVVRKTLAPSYEDLTCENVRYSFGEKQGSPPEDIENEVTVTFPVVISHGEDDTNPGKLKINVRQGSLEKLAGAINKVALKGEETGQEVSATLRLKNSVEMKSVEENVEKPVETSYAVVESGTGDSKVEVNEDAIIGVNGDKALKDRDKQPTELEGSFKGYKGASLQVIAINVKPPELLLGPLAVKAKDCTSNCVQEITEAEIYATTGKEYEELGGVGVFYHNFTELEVGPVREVESSLICASGFRDRCVEARTTVKDFEIEPGSHLLKIEYNPGTEEVTVSE